MARVLLAFPLADPAAEAALARSVDVVRADGADRAAFAAALSDVDGVILRPPATLDRAALTGAGRLRVVANIGTGLDHIDTAAAGDRGVTVLSGDGANARAVAEYVVAGLVMASRRLDAALAAVRDPGLSWATRVGALRGRELAGTTLGIVGYGAVGRHLAAMARGGLGMRIAAYDPLRPPAADEVDLVCASLDDLLDASTALSLHVPLTPQTRHLIGAAELDRLGPDGIVVNTARGGVVDEAAVIAALTAGRLRGAVFDVFETEPPGADRLAELAAVPGLILTPHIAGISVEAGSALAWRAVEGVLAALKDRP